MFLDLSPLSLSVFLIPGRLPGKKDLVGTKQPILPKNSVS